MTSKPIRIGTRGSKLALWQANHIADLLQHAGVQTEIVVIQTTGDKILDRSLSKIGSKGVFTEELEQALRDGRIDLAQHSAKDVQSHLPDDLELIAFTTRERANDVVISIDKNFKLDEEGKRIGTSSVRRVAFLRKHFPHLEVVDMRGNLQTRLEKMKGGQAEALVLAHAGVLRMGYQELIVAELSQEIFIPPVGQGSIAIQTSKKLPNSLKDLIRSTLNDTDTEICLRAERAFLATLNGGCSIPAFCLAKLVGHEIYIKAGLISTDGKQEIAYNETNSKVENEALGISLANKILDAGGRELLKEIRLKQTSG